MGADRVGPVDSIESACLLSLGDEYGSDSKGFVAEEIVTAFKATINGENVLARPFTGPKRIEFAPPLGVLTAYLFPFSDQVYYPVTLGARTAVSRLALLPQWVPGLLSVLLPLTRSALAKRRSGTSGRLGALMDWLKRQYNDLDWWGVHVEVLGVGGVQKASVQGHGQSSATALSAAAFVRALVEGEVDRPGIWTADQVVPVGPFLARLAAHGLVPTINVSERANHLSRPTILSEVRGLGRAVQGAARTTVGHHRTLRICASPAVRGLHADPGGAPRPVANAAYPADVILASPARCGGAAPEGVMIGIARDLICGGW
jgi:hypothetical protein